MIGLTRQITPQHSINILDTANLSTSFKSYLQDTSYTNHTTIFSKCIDSKFKKKKKNEMKKFNI